MQVQCHAAVYHHILPPTSSPQPAFPNIQTAAILSHAYSSLPPRTISWERRQEQLRERPVMSTGRKGWGWGRPFAWNVLGLMGGGSFARNVLEQRGGILCYYWQRGSCPGTDRGRDLVLGLIMEILSWDWQRRDPVLGLRGGILW